jgi:cobalt-zinc-cadmium efflux system protein
VHIHVHPHAPVARARSVRERRALSLALVLVLGFAVVEAVGGVVAGSLALLADAAHMLSDGLSLGLALGAAWLASRPATPDRSFGYRRAEILAALANGALLVALALWIFVEAARRLTDPPAVEAGTVLAVGAVGLGVNLLAARLLFGSAGASLNVRAALVHVLADALASIGVIVAALVILLTGWERADPLVSILIGILVLASSWGVLRESTEILMERSPSGIDAEQVGQAMAALPRVVGVHDLHIWTITSGFPSLSAHVIVDASADCHQVRVELERLLRERFGLEHTTLQVEHEQGLIELSRR